MTYKSLGFRQFLDFQNHYLQFHWFLSSYQYVFQKFQFTKSVVTCFADTKKRWWAVVVFELTVLSALYCIFYLCSINYSSQKSKQHQSQAFYTSSIFSRPRIETYGYQTRNSSAKRSNGLVSNSTRVLLVYRLMLNISILLLLAQLANDVEIQPGPGQAQSLNGLHIC